MPLDLHAHESMASVNEMKDPLRVGKAIREQLEHEIPQDLPHECDFRENPDYTITDQYMGAYFFTSLMSN